jgi:hypothetical protein
MRCRIVRCGTDDGGSKPPASCAPCGLKDGYSKDSAIKSAETLTVWRNVPPSNWRAGAFYAAPHASASAAPQPSLDAGRTRDIHPPARMGRRSPAYPARGRRAAALSFGMHSLPRVHSRALRWEIRLSGRNGTGDEAFISPSNTAGFNRPTNLRFGPDGCAYVVDYGAVRDPGGGPGGLTRFVNPADAPLVQFPGTGVIFKICHE